MRVEATAMEQNASLISQLAMSPMASRARSSAFGIASVGASPVRSGGTPTDAQARIRAKGSRPCAVANSADVTINAAAKSGIVGMTFVAARDLGSLGVRVMAIAPSLFQTGLTQGIPEEMAAGLTRDAAFPKRMGRPIEYARMALAIVENAMLNGSTIRLDAGQRFAPK